jgi:hypothetical protein
MPSSSSASASSIAEKGNQGLEPAPAPHVGKRKQFTQTLSMVTQKKKKKTQHSAPISSKNSETFFY